MQAEQPDPPPPFGGGLEVPDHPPSRIDPLPSIPKPVRVLFAGLAVFGVLNTALWVFGELGWRRALTLISSVLLMIGMLLLRYARPSSEFVHEFQREQKRLSLPVSERKDIHRGQVGVRLRAGGTLIGLAALGIAVAASAP